MTAYYLRKLINKNKDNLSWKNKQFKETISLENVVNSFSKEEIDSKNLNLLDRFIFLHQSLDSLSNEYSVQIQRLEDRIYECVNLERVQTSSNDVEKSNLNVEIALQQLNALQRKGISVLGSQIIYNYLIETRPESDLLKEFTIQKGKPITSEIESTLEFKAEEHEMFQKWIESFIEKCLTIIRTFNEENDTTSNALFSETPWDSL